LPDIATTSARRPLARGSSVTTEWPSARNARQTPRCNSAATSDCLPSKEITGCSGLSTVFQHQRLQRKSNRPHTVVHRYSFRLSEQAAKSRVGCDCRKGASDECAEPRPRRAKAKHPIEHVRLTRSSVSDENAVDGTCAPLERRGPGGPGLGRGEPHQVASCAYHLVLRSLPAEALPSRLPGLRRALRILLQLLLREHG